MMSTMRLRCLSRAMPMFTTQARWKSSFNLSAEHKKVLDATLPAVAAANTEFSKHFYDRLFTDVPCLRDLFNQTNQEIGNQPRRLFDSVAEAAVSVLEDRAFDPELLAAINHKHCALNVPAGHYDIVGQHILGTIEDLLTDDADVLAAWGALYGEVAATLNAGEKALYDATEAAEGGWTGLREFNIAKREMVSSVVARISFRPTDGKPIKTAENGQFTTVWAKPEGWKYRQPRHYTLAFDSEAGEYAISVRRQGLMSNYLHTADIGEKVQLSAPYGCFHLIPNPCLAGKNPTVFISAGIGLTPILAMLHAIDGNEAPITWLHANKSGDEHAYQDLLLDIASTQNRHLTRRVWYENPLQADGIPDPSNNLSKFHYKGRLDVKHVPDLLHLDNQNTNYYFCGPPGFMEAVKTSLLELGITQHRIHFESF